MYPDFFLLMVSFLRKFDAEFFGKLISGRLCQRRTIRPDNGRDAAVAMVEAFDIFGGLLILINIDPAIWDMMLVEQETRPA
jgi:hypothetical protein